MTSLTLNANSAFLEQILEFAKNLAKTQNVKFTFKEQNQTLKVIKEARKGKNLSKPYDDVDELMKDLLDEV